MEFLEGVSSLANFIKQYGIYVSIVLLLIVNYFLFINLRPSKDWTHKSFFCHSCHWISHFFNREEEIQCMHCESENISKNHIFNSIFAMLLIQFNFFFQRFNIPFIGFFLLAFWNYPNVIITYSILVLILNKKIKNILSNIFLIINEKIKTLIKEKIKERANTLKTIEYKNNEDEIDWFEKSEIIWFLYDQNKFTIKWFTEYFDNTSKTEAENVLKSLEKNNIIIKDSLQWNARILNSEITIQEIKEIINKIKSFKNTNPVLKITWWFRRKKELENKNNEEGGKEKSNIYKFNIDKKKEDDVVSDNPVLFTNRRIAI